MPITDTPDTGNQSQPLITLSAVLDACDRLATRCVNVSRQFRQRFSPLDLARFRRDHRCAPFLIPAQDLSDSAPAELVTYFHASSVPELTLRDFAVFLCARFAVVQPVTILTALTLALRFAKHTGLHPTKYSMHRMFVAGVFLAVGSDAGLSSEALAEAVNVSAEETEWLASQLELGCAPRLSVQSSDLLDALAILGVAIHGGNRDPLQHPSMATADDLAASPARSRRGSVLSSMGSDASMSGDLPSLTIDEAVVSPSNAAAAASWLSPSLPSFDTTMDDDDELHGCLLASPIDGE